MSTTMTMEERMELLKKRKAESARSNRKDLLEATAADKAMSQNRAKLERKQKMLEALGEKIEAKEAGTLPELERKKNWEYSIEESQNWDKRLARKTKRAQYEFTDYDDMAQRRYEKDLDLLKPDLEKYNTQKQAASTSRISTPLTMEEEALAKTAADDLYRDANSLVYADHKPSEDAIDKVISKLNGDISRRQKRSREREEVQGDITYINEKNRVFNKKLERYYNKYTQEMRDNFERGTAL